MTNDKGVLIRNIFYMLSYAFQELKKNNYENIAKEEFEHIFNLYAEILYRGVSEQLKQGLYREYVNKHETLFTLRGHLDINGTIHNIMRRKRKLDCEYDELSEDNLFNRIVKSSMLLLIRNKDVDTRRIQQLRSILPFFNNVDVIDLRQVRWNMLCFQHSKGNYRMLMAVCHLIVDGILLTTDAGDVRMAIFSDEHMSSLFEHFVLNYYKKEYPDLSANADMIEWNVDEGIVPSILPEMRSDITLHDKDKTLIIDTKYYGKMMQMHYGKQTIHSGNLYQIYTYVKNYDKEHSGNVAGVLLYAQTVEELILNMDTSIDGNRIMVRVLDLNQHFDGIKGQLEEIVKCAFG